MRIILLIMLNLLVSASSGCNKSNPTPPAPSPGRSLVGVSYTLTPPAGMSLAEDTGKTLVYTAGGGPLKPGGPVIILARSSKVFADEAMRRIGPQTFIQDMPGLIDPTGFTTQSVTVDRFPGYESACDGIADGVPVKIYCLQLYGKDGTITLLAYNPQAQGADILQTAAHSLIVTSGGQ